MSETKNQESVQDEVAAPKPERKAIELPGRRLREQRESSQLSREEVAHHLRLDVQLIKSLEEDDYSQLPSAAYICGYLRSYARLLKLPEDEVVQAYNHGELINAELIPSSVNIVPQKTFNTGLIKTVVLIVVGLALAGGLYWLADKFDIFKGIGALGTDTVTYQSSELVVPPAPEEKQKVQAQTEKPVAVPAANPGPTAETKSDAKPAAAKPSAVIQTGKTLIEELPKSKSKIPGTEPAKDVSASEQVSANTRSVPANSGTTSAQSMQTTQLRMHFNDDSWAEVTDSTGNRLVYHLVEKNTDLDLDGVPPFTVLLGNAAAVKVFYRGKEFDHSNYRHDQVANFRVGVE